MRGDRLAQGSALERVFKSIFVRGARDTQCTSTDSRTCALERLEDSDTTLTTLATEQTLRWHEAILQNYFACVRRAHTHFALLLASLQALIAFADDEGPDTGPSGRRIGRRENDVYLRNAPVSDESLGSIQHESAFHAISARGVQSLLSVRIAH